MNIYILRVMVLCIISIMTSCKTEINDSKQQNPISSENKRIVSNCLELNVLSPANHISQLDTLKGKNEMELTKVLGLPQKTELYDRGQKFFFYPVNCDSIGSSRYAIRIRFNALSYVNEILLTETED